MMTKRRCNSGFSMVEVLIAFIILVIGLLGATTLILRSTKTNVVAREYEKVAILANTFIEQMKSNPTVLDKYQRALTDPDLSKAECKYATGCSPAQRTRADLYTFQEQLKLASLPDLEWQVVRLKADVEALPGNDLYEILIIWGVKDKTPSASNPITQGRNSYTEHFVIRAP